MASVAYLSLVTAVSLIVRWSVSLNSYSGAGKGPMYGDFEAQRHWMEITWNLPAQEWYTNSSDNDLLYWGLDYPPLTAYHSWLIGAVASQVNSSWVELHKSRGLETPTHKLFMRYSVVVADLLVFIPATLGYALLIQHKGSKKQMLAAVALLLNPGLILMDHGHFQYNSVSLGFALFGILGLAKGSHLLGSLAFVLALNYKQMELYHALPFFFYLLGVCFKGSENWFLKLMKIGLVVVSTFVLCWLPFLQDKTVFLQVLTRLFPFNRGLYEDKVANFWCSLSLVVKLKQMLPVQDLVKVCLGTTLVGHIPSSIHLLIKPSFQRFHFALINSALIFFLFSFQVHEKSILLVTLPVCLILPERPYIASWFLLVSTFSMLPLLIKDGLVLAAGGTILFFCFVLGEVHTTNDEYPYMKIPKESHSAAWHVARNVLVVLSLVGCVILTIASLFVSPPKRYPDLFSVLVCAYSCMHFLLFLAYTHWMQFTCCTEDNDVECPSPKPKSIIARVRDSKSVKAARKKKL